MTSAVISTVSSSQDDLLRHINSLYLGNRGIELDVCYSKGVFYKSGAMPQPQRKYDLYPSSESVTQVEASQLPDADGSVESIMYDPPFLAGYTKPAPTGIIGKRFTGFRYMKDIWEWYSKCITEYARVLKHNGVLVIKCQDTVSSGEQWFSHVHIMNELSANGFVVDDLFILVAKSRLIGHNHKVQKHARKFHSYFIVARRKRK